MSTVTIGCKLPHGLHLDVNGTRVTVNGSNTTEIVGGHGLTEGVDKAFFEKWVSQNKNSEVIRRGLIFAHEKANNTKAEAKDKKDVKTGLEGIDPKKPAAGIEPTDEMKKNLAGK